MREALLRPPSTCVGTLARRPPGARRRLGRRQGGPWSRGGAQLADLHPPPGLSASGTSMTPVWPALHAPADFREGFTWQEPSHGPSRPQACESFHVCPRSGPYCDVEPFQVAPFGDNNLNHPSKLIEVHLDREQSVMASGPSDGLPGVPPRGEPQW